MVIAKMFGFKKVEPTQKRPIPPLKEPNPENNPTFMQWAGFVDYTPPQAKK